MAMAMGGVGVAVGTYVIWEMLVDLTVAGP